MKLRNMSATVRFPSPRGVGADLTGVHVRGRGVRQVSVPSRGWGRSHYGHGHSASQKLGSFRPLAGLGQISLYEKENMLSMAEFPSPRGVGADLTKRLYVHSSNVAGFPSPRGVGADLTDGIKAKFVAIMVSVPSRGWGRSHKAYRTALQTMGDLVSVPSRGWGRSHTTSGNTSISPMSFRPLAGLGQISL